MDTKITKSQKRYIEDCLVKIIVEPEHYGIEDAKKHRESVVNVLTELVNKASNNKLTYRQVGEVYDQVMNGDIQQTIQSYFHRYLFFLKGLCTSLYYRMEDYENLFLMYNKKSITAYEIIIEPNMKQQQDLITDTLECLEGAMIDLDVLFKGNR